MKRAMGLCLVVVLGACEAPRPPPSPPPRTSPVSRTEVEQWRRQWFKNYHTCLLDAVSSFQQANGTFYRAVPADFVNKCAATRNNALPFQSEPGMMEEFNIAEAAYLAELRKLIEVANAEEQARGKESTRQPQAAPVNEPNAMWRWRVCVIDRAMLLSSESAEPARDIVTAAFAGCVHEEIPASQLMRLTLLSPVWLEVRSILAGQAIDKIIQNRVEMFRHQQRPAPTVPIAPLPPKPRTDGIDI